jgi:hypothetical protein
MKILLGDNQFFGINHFDLKKGSQIKEKFNNEKSIYDFIIKSLDIGLDGFMINSNLIGYKLLKEYKFNKNKEIHYSIPYPHKYAAIINASGMPSLLSYFIKNTSILKIFSILPKYFFTRNLKYLIPLATNLEIPKSLPKGSTVYLQNIITDLVIGLNRLDVLEYIAKDLLKSGYKVGLITLNPILLNDFILKSRILNNKDLVVCFNVNNSGFNVFPSKKDVEKFILSKKEYRLMGMSIFASGAGAIPDSIKYINNLNLDYVVFGTSKLSNVESNFKLLKN